MAEIGSRQREHIESGVKANERITSLTGALLVVLLAMIGVTVLSVRRLLPEHFLLGFILIPPLLLKMASTGYRFARCYTGDPAYRRAGPPQLLLRLIAPVVVASTVVLFATGVELWLFGLRFGSVWIAAHKLSFMIWLPATAIHVLGHLSRTGQSAVEEFSHDPKDRALTRRSLVVGSLLAGIVVAVATLLYQSPFIFFRERLTRRHESSAVADCRSRARRPIRAEGYPRPAALRLPCLLASAPRLCLTAGPQRCRTAATLVPVVGGTAVSILKLVVTIGSTFLLTVIGATPAAAVAHRSVVSGLEFYATSTQGRFAGSATAKDANGLTGAWSIVVDHTSLSGCWQANQTCGHVTGGSFSLLVSNPAEAVSGSFNGQKIDDRPDTIVLVDPGRNCSNQRFWIADGLHSVGAWDHSGTGSFGAFLTHYRHSIFGQCITYSATVQGMVELDF